MKTGDKVKINYSGDSYNGYEGTISSRYDHQDPYWNISGPNWSGTRTYHENQLILIETKMNLKEKFLVAFLGEPEKSFRKLGITNGDNLLTAEGKELYDNWKFQKDKEAFKTEVVDGLLKEVEAEKTK